MFTDDNKYDTTLLDTTTTPNYSLYSYSFVGKDNIEYRAFLTVYASGLGKVDFTTDVNSQNPDAYLNLTNANDVQGVMNTLKFLINSHEEITNLRVNCPTDRIDFYKSIFDYHNKENSFNNFEKVIEVKWK